MKQRAKRLCSLLMAMCLLVGLIPFGALASEATDSGVEFLYQQLMLGDDLTMNFEVAIDEAVAAQAEVDLTVDGAVTPYTVSEMTANENGNYVFSVDVAAAQMTKDIDVAVTVDGSAVAQKTYTVRAYADAILNGNYTMEAKALVREMLNYGAKAQTYFNYNVENYANAGLDAVTPAVMPTEADAVAVKGEAAGISYYGSSMLFTGKLAVRYYFSAPNGVDGYTFTDANGNTYEADEKNGLYYVDVAGINPQDIDEAVVLTVSDESSSLFVSYGPMNYITRMYNGNGSESLNALLQAMYGYYLAAEAYVTNGELESTYPAVLPNYELSREENELEVFAFWMPPINEQQYAWMKEAGITAMLVDAKYSGLEHENISDILTLANKFDIDIYLTVAFSQCSATWPANFAHYLDNPNFKGFYVDEPQTQEDINNIAAMYKAADALGMRVIVNRMPWTDAEYDAWFNEAFAGSNPESLVISSTNYPLMTDSVRDEWLEINGLTNEIAAANNAEYWQFVATCGYGADSGERRQVTEADIRWQYYAALAYGPTGIQDFVYTTVIPGGEFNGDQHGAIWWTDVDDYSTYYRTDVYYGLQAVNQEIAKFDHVLLSYDWQGVMVNAVGSNSYTTAALNNAPGKLTQHDRINSISSTKDLLVGCFQDDNNYDGFLVVNFDETLNGNSAVNTVSIDFDKAYSAVAYVHGERQVVELTDGVYTCELLPGEAVFVIPIEGDVEVQPSELAIPADAVMVDDFADCAVYQGVAGVNALTDGTYTDVLPASYDYSLFSHVIFRMKASEGATVTVGGQALNIGNTDWNDVTVAISELSGTDITVTGNVWIDQIFVQYIPTELPIPEDATLVTDFSTAASPWNNPNWGTGTVGVTNWYEQYDGVAGVQAFGMQENTAIQYTSWTSVLPDDFDFSSYTHITFRLKVDKNAARALYVGNPSTTFTNYLADVSVSGEWTTLTLKIEDLAGYLLGLANAAGKSGEMVWLDQVYVRNIPDELAIPEGATMICDYSEAITPHIPTTWGSYSKVIYSNYEVYDGRAGVFGMGSTEGGTYSWFNAIGMNNIDISDATHITFRLKVKSGMRKLWIKHAGTDSGIDITDDITAYDEWIELTYNIADLGIPDVTNASIQIRFANALSASSGEWLWIDQVYVTTVEECTVSITDGTMDYEGDTVPRNTTITLTHDDTATPEYHVFAGWSVNGVAIEGNTVTVTQDVTIEPVYEVTLEELAIPQDAVLLTDYSESFTPWINTGWGSHDVETQWYSVFEGRAGVLGAGSPSTGNAWNHFSTMSTQVSLTSDDVNTLVIRYYATTTPLSFDIYAHGYTVNVPVSNFKVNEWAELHVDMTSIFESFAEGQVLKEVHIRLGSSAAGEFFYIDQMYMVNVPDELAIPEGATLFTDYATAWTPWVNGSYGSHDLAYQWYDVYEGRSGVMGYGSNVTGNSWNWFSLSSGMEFTQAVGDYVVFRLYITEPILNLSLYATGTAKEISVSVSDIPTNEWYELKVDISDLVGDGTATGLHWKLGTSVSGQTVFIDSIYFIAQ